MAGKQKLEALQCACYKPRLVSPEWERDIKVRRPTSDYMDTTGLWFSLPPSVLVIIAFWIHPLKPAAWP